MAYIKKLVMHGFKSFARRTEVVFDQGINVILGPNGSGKSNVSDALTFALGRLSAKSMRASKAKNLLFVGSKFVKPAREAVVEIVFDNKDGAFGVEKDEIILERIVKRNGQGVYKINGEVKTRTEVIEILAHAGIDPYGFNMVLQGQIQAIVKMHPEERRKIVEEVAGISIYESRKEKSLHELEKTDERLKEITTILRERTAFLRNLDKERSQALKFKELETNVKRCKASIITRKSEDKEKEINSILKSIEEKSEQREKLKKKGGNEQEKLDKISQEINQINNHIQKAAGVEQDTLRQHIANLKAELEGLKVRRENYEHRKNEVEKRIEEMTRSIPERQQEIKSLRNKSPLMAQKSAELKKKKEEFALIEQERKSLLSVKTELNSLRERIRDKERQLARATAESESLLKQLEEYSSNLKYQNEEECKKEVHSLREQLTKKREILSSLTQEEIVNEKIISVSQSEIERIEKIKDDVGKIDVCPLCQSKITASHIEHVVNEGNDKIKDFTYKLDKAKNEISRIRTQRKIEQEDSSTIEKNIASGEIELIRHRTIRDRKDLIKKYVNDEKVFKEELTKLDERRKSLELKAMDGSKIEERYDAILLEIEEISSRNEEDIDTTLLYKERELENVNNIIKRSKEDLESIKIEVDNLSESLGIKSKLLEEKEKQEKEMNEKFKKMFETRDNLQKEIQEKNLQMSDFQNEIRAIDDQINYLNIGKARLDAEKDALLMELNDYSGIELIQGSLAYLEERLKKAQEALMSIGSINMRALEVYEDVKKEYDVVQEKVNTLEKEKLQILAIIEEIDNKKSKAFMKTFRAMNELFSRNFSQLYTKGIAYLEIENKENIFEGGINIVVKLAKGKYFDVTSLSGGEQTLVALSLLFAIQEHKPYHFYIFDEIDAALDKRNSERLAGLLSQYMKSGQYIVITHNDAIIMHANVLYGVSMHDGVSKVLSISLKDENAVAQAIEEAKKSEEAARKEDAEKEQKEVEEMAKKTKPVKIEAPVTEEKETEKDEELDAEISEEDIELERKMKENQPREKRQTEEDQ